MTRHVSFHTGDHFICHHCEEPWPCETARLAHKVEQLEAAVVQVLACGHSRCSGCRTLLSRAHQS